MSSSGASAEASAWPILHSGRWPSRGLDKAITALSSSALCAEYASLRANAPKRSATKKPYFVGHTGVTSSTGHSNRLEEHYAIGLMHLKRRWTRPDGGWFEILDYQVPLKARQSDARVGKIDLLAITDQRRLVITELKVQSQGGGRSDPPPCALLEGLRYAAMVQGDFPGIAAEMQTRFGLAPVEDPPIVMLLAPEGWWKAWRDLRAAGSWGPALQRLANEVENATGVSIEFAALEDTSVTYGLDGQPPELSRAPGLRRLTLSTSTSSRRSVG